MMKRFAKMAVMEYEECDSEVKFIKIRVRVVM